MKIIKCPDAMVRAHLLAMHQVPDQKFRVVALFGGSLDDMAQELLGMVLCARGSGCAKCTAWLHGFEHLELGVILPVKVDRVGVSKATAPAASDGFPQ